MVRIVSRPRGKKFFYYLEHTLREGSKVRKEEKYLGKTIPKNIDALKREFLVEINKKKWHPPLETIKANYSKELSRIPCSVNAKQERIFSTRFTYDSNKIEGSRLTYRETADLLERGISPKGKLEDVKDAEAHDKLFKEVLDYKGELKLQTILSWHRKLFIETKPDIAGKIRDYPVAISGCKYTPPAPIEVYPLLKEYLRWYNREKKNLNPVELAGLAHLKLVTIHPFGDGNGRISRLIMNHILNKEGYPMLNIPYINRASYYNALERAQTKKQEHIYTQWHIKKYIKENKKYL